MVVFRVAKNWGHWIHTLPADVKHCDSVFLPYFNSHSINKDLFHSVVSGMFSTSLVCVCVCVCVYVCDSAI